MQYTFPCVLTPEDDDPKVFTVTFPDVPEAITYGSGRAHALAQAQDALVTALSFYVEGREEIPVPGEGVPGQEWVTVPAVVAAKLALYTAMRRKKVTQVELARRLGVRQSAIHRLLDLRHRSHIDQVESGLRATGRVLVIGDRAMTPPPRPARPQPA